MSPLYGFDEKEKAAFLDTLSVEERERIGRAQSFYDRVIAYTGSEQIGPVDLLPRSIPKEKRESVDGELHRLSVRFPFPENNFQIGGKKIELEPEKFAAFQQELVESVYERTQKLVESEAYRQLTDSQKAKVLDAFAKEVAGARRLKARSETVLESGQWPRSVVEDARRARTQLRERDRETTNPAMFIREQLKKQRAAQR